ncbi:replicative DNA helicase [Chitinophaga niabensis]|uniref:replicative DNA helicase n=1 Tax=Chitinophaga niabensis TaxID=536979 RepID=UPI0031B9E478
MKGFLFDKDIERAVLGAILLEKTAIARVSVLLRPEMFYVRAHEEVAKAVFVLFKKASPIDIITVWGEIKKAGNESKITMPELASMTNSVVSSAHLEDHTMKLAELYMSRELQKITGSIHYQSSEWGHDVFDLVSDLQKSLSDLLAGTMQGGLVGIDRIIVGTLKYIDSIKPGVMSGVPSGIDPLDKIFFGYKADELHVIAARPGCGKTALALQILRNAAKAKKKGAFFSLEMNRDKINQRMFSAESGVDFAKIQRNQMEDFERQLMSEAADRLARLPIYMDDSFSQNVQVLHSKCIQQKFRTGLDFAVVDYLQLIGGNRGSKSQNREQQIAEISRGLKGMAKDLRMPVFALSQMSRDIEKGGRKEPVLSDLRESGAIEQDADSVLFLTPEEESEEVRFGDPILVRFKIAKQRDGAKLSFPMKFEGNFMRFSVPETESNQHSPRPANWHPVHNTVNEEDGPF